MRIISGKYKGRRLQAPKKLPVRPTTDMAKESLFNIINNLYYFDDLTVLDLFSGTGNISYEFSSRGVEYVCALEINKKSIEFIKNFSKKKVSCFAVLSVLARLFLHQCTRGSAKCI